MSVTHNKASVEQCLYATAWLTCKATFHDPNISCCEEYSVKQPGPTHVEAFNVTTNKTAQKAMYTFHKLKTVHRFKSEYICGLKIQVISKGSFENIIS